MKLLAAIVADHIISGLAVPFFLGKADIAGIKGCPENIVFTFYNKETNGIVLFVKRVIMGLAVIDFFERDSHLPVDRFDALIATSEDAEQGMAAHRKKKGL